MWSLLEETRQLHQDLEVNADLIVTDLVAETKTVKERILQESKVHARLEKLEGSAKLIIERYDDEDGVRRQELDEITGDDVFTTFYEKLRGIRRHYREHPNDESAKEDYDLKVKPKFASSEVHGNFIDLQTFFERYINLPVFEKCANYMTFLGKFEKFKDIPQTRKLIPTHFKAYKQYLEDLKEYMMSFQQRTNPLVKVELLQNLVHKDFKKKWDTLEVPGWQGGDQDEPKEDPAHADNPLYCKACCKLFTKSSTFTSHLAGRKHKKNVESAGKEKKEDPRKKELAQLEHTIVGYADLLKEVISNTQDYVLKKQTRTYEEMAADLEEQHDDEALTESDSDEDELVYNPLNLPLGWDGKPIPYWLYKLHGLNIEYKCDICGGFTYKGPRAYERHFSEWRHTYGMRCLGIPNTKDFLHITKFEDAIALHEKIEKKATDGTFKAEEDEEFEDDDGNVFKKKTFDDLKRQGII